jgi:hypothetical protein
MFNSLLDGESQAARVFNETPKTAVGTTAIPGSQRMVQ